MKLNEMEKRMLYQTEGSDKREIFHELFLALRYAGDPMRRKAAGDLMEKLRPLSDEDCMEAIKDIQKNYQLPPGNRTVGELLAQARQRIGAEKLKGHDILALERFEPGVRHMIIFEVVSRDSQVGDRGDRMRLFLTNEGYEKFQDKQEKGEIRIQSHARVAPGGYLHDGWNGLVW